METDTNPQAQGQTGSSTGPSDNARRQVAYKVSIADVMGNPYVKEEGWLPNYVQIGPEKVSRVNIIAVIVSKAISEEGNETFIIDDSTDRTSLRFFKPDDVLNVGDVVLVIGRPREFGADRYIVPEIIKRLSDPKWVEVRKIELARRKHKEPPEGTVESDTPTTSAPPIEEKPYPESGDGGIQLETEDLSESPTGRILDAIRQLDQGPGVSYGEIAAKTDSDADKWITKLLETGDIFEVKPGRFKVLE